MRSPFGELLAALAGAFDALGARFYLFGAQAALLYGSARLTADVVVEFAGTSQRDASVEATHVYPSFAMTPA